ncbi:MAG: hypothetical protein JO149_01290, partial [Gammaproteobacteria bacterium]|nr:hypothetical protein [Gammaproteobacteria bacterium]
MSNPRSLETLLNKIFSDREKKILADPSYSQKIYFPPDKVCAEHLEDNGMLFSTEEMQKIIKKIANECLPLNEGMRFSYGAFQIYCLAKKEGKINIYVGYLGKAYEKILGEGEYGVAKLAQFIGTYDLHTKEYSQSDLIGKWVVVKIIKVRDLIQPKIVPQEEFVKNKIPLPTVIEEEATSTFVIKQTNIAVPILNDEINRSNSGSEIMSVSDGSNSKKTRRNSGTYSNGGIEVSSADCNPSLDSSSHGMTKSAEQSSSEANSSFCILLNPMQIHPVFSFSKILKSVDHYLEGEKPNVFTTGEKNMLEKAYADKPEQLNHIGEFYRESVKKNQFQQIIIMPLEKGISLESYLEKHPQLSLQQTFTLMSNLLKITCELLDKGILHRDIKPGNIVVDDLLNLAYIDYGSAVQTDTKSMFENKIVGTPTYLDPLIFLALFRSDMIEYAPIILDANPHVIAKLIKLEDTLRLTRRVNQPTNLQMLSSHSHGANENKKDNINTIENDLVDEHFTLSFVRGLLIFWLKNSLKMENEEKLYFNNYFFGHLKKVIAEDYNTALILANAMAKVMNAINLQMILTYKELYELKKEEKALLNAQFISSLETIKRGLEKQHNACKIAFNDAKNKNIKLPRFINKERPVEYNESGQVYSVGKLLKKIFMRLNKREIIKANEDGELINNSKLVFINEMVEYVYYETDKIINLCRVLEHQRPFCSVVRDHIDNLKNKIIDNTAHKKKIGYLEYNGFLSSLLDINHSIDLESLKKCSRTILLVDKAVPHQEILAAKNILTRQGLICGDYYIAYDKVYFDNKLLRHAVSQNQLLLRKSLKINKEIAKNTVLDFDEKPIFRA